MDILGEKLMKLKTREFFAKKQLLFVNNVKSNLQEGEFLVCYDFAENYALVIQNSTQSFHWNNNQATVFTVVVYYKQNDELKHVSIAVIILTQEPQKHQNSSKSLIRKFSPLQSFLFEKAKLESWSTARISSGTPVVLSIHQRHT